MRSGRRSRRARLASTLGVLLLAGCSRSASHERSLLLVTLDTTRADALSMYGGPETPALARLAGEGVVFEHAQSAVPLTLPAHATILTGLTPLRHGLRDNGRGPLAPEARTLAEAAHEAGFQTAAFVGAVVLDRSFGLDQGFERYDAPVATPGGSEGGREPQRPASEVIDAALSWLGTRDRERPFFLWTHFYDPHTPYEPPPEFAGRTVREKYDGEVRAMDRQLGRLFDALRAEGALDTTLVIVIGDHGEAFGEHGEHGHGPHGWQSTLHVPFLLRAPFFERLAPGARSGELAGLVDVFPTAAEALGLEFPGDLDGFSLWSEPAPTDRGLYFESYYGWLNFGWSPLAGWIDASGKYLHSSDPRFYDWKSDPEEVHDLVDERAADVRNAQRAMAFLAEKPRLTTAAGAASEELLTSLAGLGYASSSSAETFPHPLESTGLPSPESMIPFSEKTLDAIEAGQAGRVAEAEALLREVLAVNPENPMVLEQLATCLLSERRYPEAVAALERLVSQSRGRGPGAFLKLGLSLEAAGNPSRAIEALRSSLAMDPERVRVRTELARLLRAAGRNDEAREVMKTD